MTQSFEEKLCDVLVKNKIITLQESADLKKDFVGRSKENFDDFLLSEEIIPKDDLLQALSEVYEVPAFDIVGHFFKRDLLLQFPKDFLVRHAIIPLERDGNMLVIIASEPDNLNFVNEMSEYVSDDTRFFVGIRQEIMDAVDEFYEESPFSSDGEINASDELYEDAKILDDVFDE